MANKIDKSKPIAQQKNLKEIADALFQAKLERANWLQKLILKKIVKK